ncbi:MAG: NAD(+) synthase [Bdellovibrionota bacterium]
MKKFGFIRVSGANTSLKVGDTDYNTDEIIKMVDKAVKQKVDILSFGELSITSYSCADLFLQETLINASKKSLINLKKYSTKKNITFIVGAPILIDGGLHNCAVVINKGKILGVIPKTNLVNYNEFSEKRWFKNELQVKTFIFDDEEVSCGTDLIFKNDKYAFGVEIGEDLWSIYPNSSKLALGGANLIFNLAASNELVSKHQKRHDLIKVQSSKTLTGYVYVSNNINESTTDLVFSGANIIYEAGKLINEGERFNFDGELITGDIDVSKLINDRINFINDAKKDNFRYVPFVLSNAKQTLNRRYEKTPFIQVEEKNRKERCEEILNIQSSGLAKRMKHTEINKTVIGLSGGLDSTLALLVIDRANKKLNIDNSNIITITMRGFGTTDRTYQNALKLAKVYGTTLKEIDIKEASLLHFKDIDHDANIYDTTYENVQARERTQILMDIANKEGGLVIGTGDLSEIALGWSTYNGDHMSMYAANSSIPKTLVKYLIAHIRDNTRDDINADADIDKKIFNVLNDILDTPISPELLPLDSKGDIIQKTEDKIGPYVLHDFFLYHFIRNKATPSKIFELAKNTFKDDYSNKEILKWLNVFFKRFFSQQFKRSCMPDGVKVGSVSLSPRGDFKMPSDASCSVWLKDLESVKDYEDSYFRWLF